MSDNAQTTCKRWTMALQQLKGAWVDRCKVGTLVLQKLQALGVAFAFNIWQHIRSICANVAERNTKAAPTTQTLRVGNNRLQSTNFTQ